MKKMLSMIVIALFLSGFGAHADNENKTVRNCVTSKNAAGEIVKKCDKKVIKKSHTKQRNCTKVVNPDGTERTHCAGSIKKR